MSESRVRWCSGSASTYLLRLVRVNINSQQDMAVFVCIHPIPSPDLNATENSFRCRRIIPFQSVKVLQACEDVKCIDLQHDLISKLCVEIMMTNPWI